MANIVALDIETKAGSPKPKVTTQEIQEILRVEAEAKWKTKARQDKHINDPNEHRRIDEKLLKDWADEGLDMLKGEIYCISACMVPNDPAQIEVVTFSQRKHKTEELMLKAFVKWMRENNMHGPPAIAGWNSTGFDMPFLVWRLAKYDMHDDARDFVPSKWGDKEMDLMVMAKLGARGKQHKLDAMAQYFGMGGKPVIDPEACLMMGLPEGTKMDGSLVWKLLLHGYGEMVEEYCASDTRAVALMLPTIEFLTRRSRK